MSIEDAALPTLPLALDVPIAGIALREALAGELSEPLPRLASVEIVKLRPGRRGVLRYDFAPSTASGDPLVLIAKLRAKGVDRRVDRIARALRARGFAEGGDKRFVVPRSFGCVPALSLQLQRWHAGSSLGRVVSRLGQCSTLSARVGAALAELHHSPVPAERTHRVEDELAILERDLALALKDRPELAGRIEAQLARARASIGPLADRPLATVHRDFHPDQVLVDGETLVLLDLDLYAWGDPLVDVANFVAHLREQGLRERGQVDAYVNVEARFLEGYEAISGSRLPRAAFAAWLYLSLLRHVYIAWRIPERRPHQESILAYCEALEVHAEAD